MRSHLVYHVSGYVYGLAVAFSWFSSGGGTVVPYTNTGETRIPKLPRTTSTGISHVQHGMRCKVPCSLMFVFFCFDGAIIAVSPFLSYVYRLVYMCRLWRMISYTSSICLYVHCTACIVLQCCGRKKENKVDFRFRRARDEVRTRERVCLT